MLHRGFIEQVMDRIRCWRMVFRLTVRVYSGHIATAGNERKGRMPPGIGAENAVARGIRASFPAKWECRRIQAG
jgi:hypothetical protein